MHCDGCLSAGSHTGVPAGPRDLRTGWVTASHFPALSYLLSMVPGGLWAASATELAKPKASGVKKVAQDIFAGTCGRCKSI